MPFFNQKGRTDWVRSASHRAFNSCNDEAIVYADVKTCNKIFLFPPPEFWPRNNTKRSQTIMKSTITTLLLLSPLVSRMAQGACTLTCPEDTVCYSASISDAADCWNNIPTNVEWKNNTLNTISQSLENFGFGALYHNTGPPYNLKVPVMEELEATKAMVFDNDFQFQEHLQGILTSLLDAHTRYSKPQCYSATLVMPMAFDFKLTETVTNSGAVQSEPTPYFIPSTYYNQYDEQFGGVDAALFSQPVALINGVEVITAIDSWGSGHETRSNNAGARFNAALRSFLYRSVVR